ncbi:MAG: HAMP domain-containing sensor histidine kinase [Solirubrobacteraceae bacterium]|jgi:signal transduction histidine kinase
MRLRRRARAFLGSIRTRLAIFFFLITLIAVAVVYVYAVPSLQSRLQQQELNDVGHLAATVRLQAASNAKKLARYTSKLQHPQRVPPPKLRRHETAAEKRRAEAAYKVARTAANARQLGYANDASSIASSLAQRTSAKSVTLLEFTKSANGGVGPPDLVYPTQTASQDIYAAASNAFAAGKRDEHAYSSNFGAVAVPVKNTEYVFVYSVTFSDVHSDVVLIRTRILVAAAIALAVVLLLGVLVARALTVRVLRLEHAAQRVAQGDLSAQFEVDSSDELGRLAAALANMQSQLSQLEQARRRFIATASHELRTPIFSLGGFLELIQDEDLDEETRRAFLTQVREQVARLGRLATGLLDLSRLEAGSVELEPTPTDLGVLSRAVASEFVPALALHESELDLSLPDQPLRVLVDPERVAQILRILIDNAITHTPTGTPVTVAVADGDGAVRLRVTDRGPGIRTGVVERIFEPFYTADGTRGAGLGLAIARELAERQHGTLEVTSDAQGSVFTLTLPGES